MALARIISNSDLCSRELAINLLERGYAVEIVSPDAIPDNFADLEVRVETGPADLLSASVEVRGGSHSSTLQFIHQLKSPSLDMKRPAPIVMPEDATSDITIPALAIPVNPPRATELVTVSDAAIADITIPALAIPANLPRISELVAISDATLGDITMPANPPRTTAPCEPIPISTTALATAIKPRIVEAPDVLVEPMIKPVVVEKPELVVAPANPAPGADSADLLTLDPPKKPAAFSEDASLIVLPKPSPEGLQKVVEQSVAQPTADHAVPASGVLKLVIPKPSLPRLTIPRFDLKRGQELLTRCKDWVRRVAVRPAGWVGWTALGFAGVMALGLVLELASARMNGTSRHLGSAAAENGAAVDSLSLLATPGNEGQYTARAADVKSSIFGQSSQGKPSAMQIAPLAPGGKSAHPAASSKLRTSPPAKAAKVVAKSKVVHHSDEVIAPDTITYFTRPGAKPVPVEQSARQRADSHKHGTGVVATNSVPAKTVPKDDSGK